MQVGYSLGRLLLLERETVPCISFLTENRLSLSSVRPLVEKLRYLQNWFILFLGAKELAFSTFPRGQPFKYEAIQELWCCQCDTRDSDMYNLGAGDASVRGKHEIRPSLTLVNADLYRPNV